LHFILKVAATSANIEGGGVLPESHALPHQASTFSTKTVPAPLGRFLHGVGRREPPKQESVSKIQGLAGKAGGSECLTLQKSDDSIKFLF
jgi:hypothetical protein